MEYHTHDIGKPFLKLILRKINNIYMYYLHSYVILPIGRKEIYSNLFLWSYINMFNFVCKIIEIIGSMVYAISGGSYITNINHLPNKDWSA